MAIRVDGEEIPEAAIRFEYDRLVRFYSDHMPPSRIKEQQAALRRRAVDQAIGAKLLLREASRLDLRVPAGDIDARLDALVEQAGGREAFDALLRRQRLTADGVRAGIEKGRQVDLLVERVSAGASEPGEDEMKSHYDAHRDDYVRPERIQVQHILIKPDARDPQGREKAEALMAEIRRKLADGVGMAELAAAHSQCPSGRKTGGSLGWVSRGMLVGEFEAAVFALPVGRLSDVVETPLGLHLILTNAREEGGPASYVEVREKVRDFLRHVRRGEALSAYVNELRAKAKIEGLDAQPL